MQKKALLKKQLNEIALAFSFNSGKKRKTKRNAHTSKKAGSFIGLLAILAICMLAFFGASMYLAPSMLSLKLDWLFFAMMGLLSFAVSLTGTTVYTYSALFKSNDNELLLSLPIPSGLIVSTRFVSVYITAFIYSGISWLATILAYCVSALTTGEGISLIVIIFCVLLSFVIAAFSTALSCFVGWIVALISRKIKRKSIVTAIIVIVVIILGTWLRIKAKSLTEGITNNASDIANALHESAWPLYALGKAATGDVLLFLALLALAAILVFLCYLVISKTFVSLATKKPRNHKVEKFETKQIATSSVKNSLFKRELKRLVSSTVYLVNYCIGIVLLLLAAIAAVVFSATLHEFFEPLCAISQMVEMIVSVCIAALICLIASTSPIAAPSISLEGRSLWIIRSLPVSTKQVLAAKRNLHITVVAIPSVLCTFVLLICCGFNIVVTLCASIFVCCYVILHAYVSLMSNLKWTNLDWTNESYPVKQSLPVTLCIFGGWGVCFLLGAGFVALAIWFECSAITYLLVVSILMLACTFLVNKWINNTGTKNFETLKV